VTVECARTIRTLRDEKVRLRLKKAIARPMKNPLCGKPLRYELQGKRSVRVPPFRIIYEIHDERLILLAFENRSSIYRE
jgi:mRNA-degrading endonuclease RelE of RelBE toxin-antitoxin system